jgi:segregation and condensation protein B
MSQIPDSSPEPVKNEGISLDELAQAFAQVMGADPRMQHAADHPNNLDQPAETTDQSAESSEGSSDGEPASAEEATISPVLEDNCPLSPRSILEAMLFVGNRDNLPLQAAKAAELMRDVAPEDIPAIADELNQKYDADNSPYQVVAEGDGYRLTLRKNLSGLRNRFFGRIREVRLSQAAIDILAIIAYQQPLTGDQINRFRGKPSNHILTQLVRRGLLKIDRPAANRRTPHYSTTERFMRLFNLQSLDDLPRSEDSLK